MPKCSDIMTKDPVCCATTDNAVTAAQLMKSEGVGPIPVVEDERTKRLAGIVTDRDLVLKVIAEGRNPTGTLLQDIMTPDPKTCGPDDDIQLALGIMAEAQVRRVPVVDENGALIGIIAQADIATRMEQPHEVAEVVEEISEASSNN